MFLSGLERATPPKLVPPDEDPLWVDRNLPVWPAPIAAIDFMADYAREVSLAYDLYIAPRPGFGALEFADYFSSRGNYTLEQDGAYYANDDTGVYFSFHLIADTVAAAGADFNPRQGQFLEAVDLDEFALPVASPLPMPHVSFTLNYVRPHVFGLEAACELTLFYAAHGDWVDDPQIHGMNSDYSELGFLSGWDRGNRSGYGALVGRIGKAGARAWAEAGFLLAGSPLIEAAWRWNYARLEIETALAGAGIFVPIIVLGERLNPAHAVSIVVWGDGAPIAIPLAADYVILARQQLHGRKGGIWARLTGKDKAETSFAMVKRQQIEALASARRQNIDGQMVIRIGDAGAPIPADVVEFVSTQADVDLARALRLVAMDKVLNRELVDELRKSMG